MATYLLLRNNKESGPLTFDELKRIGLKPYDLVWVNGKSAAWRYPSEISELIPYVPIVNESTNDRSVHQPVEQKQEILNFTKPSNVVNEAPELPASEQPIQTQKGFNQVNKKVFVSLPERKPEYKPVITADNKPIASKYSNTQNDYRQPTSVNAIPDYRHADANTFEPVELEEKYSQPLDEIKEMYVQTLNQRKKRNARKQAFWNSLKIAAAVLVIMSVGMLIGMYFMNDKQNPQLVEEPVKPANSPTELSSTSFVSNSKNQEMNVNEVPANDNFNDYQVSTTEKKPANIPIKNKKSTETDKTQVLFSGTVTDAETNERKRSIRNEDSSFEGQHETASKKSSIENIWNDVTLKANDFKTGPFGGIKDLTITLANKSSYQLDKVEIEVKYIGLEKQIVKTQKMVFNDVLPGGQVHADVPRTGRGMDVDVSIKKINVKDFSFARSDK